MKETLEKLGDVKDFEYCGFNTETLTPQELKNILALVLTLREGFTFKYKLRPPLSSLPTK